VSAQGIAVAGEHHSDQRLVAGVRAGEAACVVQLLAAVEKVVWPTVAAVVGEGQAFQSFPAIVAALSESGFQRLAGYDGRSSLASFLVLLTRELLGEDIQRLLATDQNRAWRRFRGLFEKDIRRLIRKHFPRGEEDDLFQEVEEKLVEKDYRRLRLYQGKGSFFGYVLMVVNRLLLDLQRQEAGRRRLPVEVARLSKLHQLLFVAGAWKGILIDPDRMAEIVVGKIEPLPDRAQVDAALEKVSPLIAQSRASAKPRNVPLGSGSEDDPGPEIISDDLNPEEQMVRKQQEEADQALVELVKRKAEQLPPDLRLYLQLTLQASDDMPPRVAARQMAVPVDEIYKLQQKKKGWLKEIGIEAQKMAASPSSPGRSLNPA
jgi:RNA polymerase primary sigma factor